MSEHFQARKEDFSCERCGIRTKGDGYTNHCPGCLWSKHVDVYPGDRAEFCGGLMRPVSVSGKKRKHCITHKCESCGIERINKTHPNDNFEAILALC